MSSKEQPVFTTKAHIFTLDLATKKDWKPISRNAAVPLVIYHNEEKNLFRIISFTTDQKILINCTFTSQMRFTKSSSKFCQFTDASAKTTYGLGFSSSADQTKFKDQFEMAVAATKAQLESDSAITPVPESAQGSFSAPRSKSSSTSSLDQDSRTPTQSKSNMASPTDTKALVADGEVEAVTSMPVQEEAGNNSSPRSGRRGSETAQAISMETPPSPSRKAAMVLSSGLESPRRDRPSSASGKKPSSNLLSKLLTGGGSGRDVRDDPEEVATRSESTAEPVSRSPAQPADINSSRQGSLKKEQQTRDESPKRPAQVGRRPSISGPATPDLSDQMSQMKRENDQLKAALATSSSRANQWEAELQRLKHNNVRLLTTLQESQNNVDEWKRQLTLYKDDNASLKQKMKERELAEHQVNQLQQEASGWERTKREMSEELKELKTALAKKEQECESLTNDLETLSTLAPKLQVANDKCKDLAAAKAELSDKLAEAQDQLRLTRTASSIRLERLTEQHKTLGSALRELTDTHAQMEQDLQ